MSVQGLLTFCARQDRDVSYPFLKSHSVIAFYLLHTENEMEKTEEWGGAKTINPYRSGPNSHLIRSGGGGGGPPRPPPLSPAPLQKKTQKHLE